jgi:leucyl-tRNA---protein transferase
MTLPNDPPLQRLQFYATTPYSCGYLPNLAAQSLIATPQHLINAKTYSDLIQLGFRRSGKFVYRPHCEHCHACIPVRIPVAQFKPNRSQQRTLKKHHMLQVSVHPLEFQEEHYALYTAYQATRHESNAEDETMEQYRNFLVQSNVKSMLVEFRQNEVLKIVSIVDIVEDGISAVYTFYDSSVQTPADKSNSYGTYSILWLMEWCRMLQLPYLYLGYWIKDSKKMAYKQNFQPQEVFMNNEWQLLSPASQSSI